MRFGGITKDPQIPANTRLWEMLIARAKHKFRVYPSMAASHWVHEEYLREGGQFVRSRKNVQKDRTRTRSPIRKKKDDKE